MRLYSEAIESKLAALRLSIRAKDDGYEDTEYKRRFGAYERRYLNQASAFFWSKPITDAVLGSARTLPRDTKLSLAAYAENQCGWFWFEDAVKCCELSAFKAVLWSVGNVQDAEDYNRSKRVLTISTYAQSAVGLEVCDTLFLKDLVSWDELISTDERFKNEPALRDAAEAAFPGEEIIRPSEGAGIFSFMLTALLWIDQQIVVGQKTQPDRATRRRLQREGLDDQINALNVIALRRSAKNHDDNAEDEGHVEWSCQWIVRGHWRQQFYPASGERRPLWILPYVKGPEDKPLKAPSPTVFAVTR